MLPVKQEICLQWIGIAQYCQKKEKSVCPKRRFSTVGGRIIIVYLPSWWLRWKLQNQEESSLRLEIPCLVGGQRLRLYMKGVFWCTSVVAVETS